VNASIVSSRPSTADFEQIRGASTRAALAIAGNLSILGALSGSARTYLFEHFHDRFLQE
jgi:hypothetical protein